MIWMRRPGAVQETDTMPTPKLTRRMYLYFTPDEATLAEALRVRLGLHSINETVRTALGKLALENGLAPASDSEEAK